MSDLESRKWEKTTAQVEFQPNTMAMQLRATDPAFLASFTQGGSKYSRRAAFRCIKCAKMRPLDSCPNCDSMKFNAGVNTDGIGGVFCFECDRGFVTWLCDECGTENPVRNSIVTEVKKGCFVATVAYGGADVSEVILLRRFRDDVLLRTRMGRNFVDTYYEFGPALSRWLEDRHFALWLMRHLVLNPIVTLLRVLVSDNKP